MSRDDTSRNRSRRSLWSEQDREGEHRPMTSVVSGGVGRGLVPTSRSFLVVVSVVVALSACTPSDAPADAALKSPEAPASAFVPEGSAADNKAIFDLTNVAVVAAASDAQGQDFVAALVAVGFPKDAMQLTADGTSVGLDADSVQFSVKIGPDCLIGQYGPHSGGYHGIIAAPIATGACLVGRTTSID